LKGSIFMPNAQRPLCYFDNASTSYPKPKPVYEVLASYLQIEGANPGRAAHRMAVNAGNTVEETRGLLAAFFDADSPDRVAFALNCTDALNMAIKGVVVPGDHVIASSLEHNSIMRPLKRMEAEGTIQLTQLPISEEGCTDPEDVKRNIRPNTRLVALTHASNVLGTVQPIGDVGKICRDHGVLYLVDGAQTAGILPISMKRMHIDLLAVPGHKALLGPPGTGALISGKRAEPIAFREGGTGTNSEYPVQPTEMPTRLEAGTPNTLGIAGLKAGLEFISKRTLDAIALHEHGLVERFLHGLREIKRVRIYGSSDKNGRVATVSVSFIDKKPGLVARELDEKFNIAIRPGLHCAPYAHAAIGTLSQGTARFPFFEMDIIVRRQRDTPLP